MVKNDPREVLNFGSSMVHNHCLAQLYLEVAWDIVHLSKRDKDVNNELLYFL